VPTSPREEGVFNTQTRRITAKQRGDRLQTCAAGTTAGCVCVGWGCVARSVCGHASTARSKKRRLFVCFVLFFCKVGVSDGVSDPVFFGSQIFKPVRKHSQTLDAVRQRSESRPANECEQLLHLCCTTANICEPKNTGSPQKCGHPVRWGWERAGGLLVVVSRCEPCDAGASYRSRWCSTPTTTTKQRPTLTRRTTTAPPTPAGRACRRWGPPW